MGGFAGAHHDAIAELERGGDCRLICTCDPNMGGFSERACELEFERRGVRFFGDYVEMLDACRNELDVVTVPTPVPLHATMHEACVMRGIPVYLEKPPTVNYSELDDMLAVEATAAKLTNVGFNFIIENERRMLKRRIVDGEFGAVRKVCFSGLWPRSSGYYGRAKWAGKLMLDEALVLDSCMSNALAHYVHNVLFWAGCEELFSWAEVESVTAQLYRAHDIQGFDTVFATAETSTNVDLALAISHACDGPHRHREIVVCEKATIVYVVNEDYRVYWDGGQTESGKTQESVGPRENLTAYFAYLRGEADRPVTRLVDSRPFVRLCDLVYLASGRINQVPRECVDRHPEAAGSPNPESTMSAIQGLDTVFEEFLRSGAFPDSQGAAWGRSGGSATPADLTRLPGVVQEMVTAANHQER